MDSLSSFLNTTRTVDAVIRRIAKMLRPPERIGTTDWARKHRGLSAKGSASPGRYDPNITPWVFGMHAALDDPTVQKVVCMKSAQVAWTDGMLLNYIGKRIDVDPCPMIVVFPKEKTAKKFNLEKFEPMVEVTPRLSARLPVHAARDKNNLWDHKTFARGFLKCITSNAPDDVKSTPAPVVAVEEPDDANTHVREQGDSITLLEERNKSYSDQRRKMILGGTLTVDGLSRIQKGDAASDQRVYLVLCPDCDEEHELARENVTWSEGAEVVHEVYGRAQSETARYTCPHCGSLWDDATRIRAVRRGRWVATAPFHGVAGFRVNELVSPFPRSNMAELVKKWLTADKALREGEDTKMRSFVNNSQCRPYKYKTDLPELDVLAQRALPYAELTVPVGGLLLTLGVDVQHDRLAIVVRAWGRGEESWLVVWGQIFGNVTEQQQDPLTGGVWGALTMLLSHGYPGAGEQGRGRRSCERLAVRCDRTRPHGAEPRLHVHAGVVHRDRAGVLSGDRRDQDGRRREEHARYAARRADHDGDRFEGVLLRVVVACGQASGPNHAVCCAAGHHGNGRTDRAEGDRIGSGRAPDAMTR